MKFILIEVPHYDRRNLVTGLLDVPPIVLFSKVKRGSEPLAQYGKSGDVIGCLGTFFSGIPSHTP